MPTVSKNGLSRAGRPAALGVVLLVAIAVTACTSSTRSTTTGSGKTSAASVVSAPVQKARTSLGTVAYRTVGSGPPLVLVMGYGGTMETWDPRFVDTLARHYRVVVFDNSGLGGTQAVPAPLTIDAMADQTAALVETLGLKAPDVLGWSMGSMIAQALAIRHPRDVGRLVLCAAYPGDGSAVVPPQANIDALKSGKPDQVRGVLYPADQTYAYDAFTIGVTTYPSAAPASASVVSAQDQAILDWWHGTDPAGREPSSIGVPTLVADGEQDALDDAANSRALAGLIPNTTLQLYPDAGHAFLFQEGTPFVFVLETFFGGAPAPASEATVRATFLSGQDAVTAAGTTFANGLRAFASHPTALALAQVCAAYAAVVSGFEDQLLGLGTSGSLNDAVAAVVDAEEVIATDVLALPAQPTGAAAWTAAATADGKTLQTATAALRRALGLPPASTSPSVSPAPSPTGAG